MLFVSEHVTNLFHSLLNAFQCWFSLYLIHFLSLFFHYLSQIFRSLSYQGFLCLLVIVFVVAGAITLDCFEHFVVELVGCHIKCCALQDGYVVEFPFELCDCIISELLQGSLF